ncbi:MAG: hypothetical protein AAGC46_13290 [Solirubrobacteraceae bacterium]|nr:hypothetical protein [Patulibacter sp.]
MSARPSRPFVRLALPLALAVAVPGQAAAAGFAPPVRISGHDQVHGATTVAVAPTGRTMVLYDRERQVGQRDVVDARVVVGAAPDVLSRPAPLRVPGAPKGIRADSTQLFARQDGSFVLCLSTRTRQGCAVAPPTGGFGRFVRLPGTPKGMTALPRPDGSVVLLRSQVHERPGSAGIIDGTDLSVTVLGTDGRLGPEQVVSRSQDEQDYNGVPATTATAADGTIAIAANMPAVPGKLGRVRLGIRLLAPGADTFGPIVAVPAPLLDDNNIELLGGPAITVEYRTGDPFDQFDEHFVPRNADGTFAPTLELPGAVAGAVDGTVVTLPGGGLFAVTSRVTTGAEDQDCFNPVTGVVGSGALTPEGQRTPSTQLSTRGQIAWHERALALTDGTVIAAWHDGVNEAGDRRVEASVRTPGAPRFTTGQRLAPLLGYSGEPILAGAGPHAALVWPTSTAGHPDGLVLSVYRTGGPYAKSAPLPKHPGTSCDE